jgi:hypothetical protein
MEIKVKLKNVYGQDLVYPVCSKEKVFAQIAGTTTLTPETLSKITLLGYEVTNEPTKLNFRNL